MGLPHTSRRNRSKNRVRGARLLDALELRRLLCGVTHTTGSVAHELHAGGDSDIAAEPELPRPATEVSGIQLAPTSPAAQAAATVGPNVASNQAPVLNSDPGAPAALYLDFVGDDTADWGGYHPGHTPALDQDGNVNTFSPAELSTIHDTWAAVAEDYSPFNINVTTVDPRNLDDGKTMKVVIGGSGAWYGQPAGGVSFIGSFVSPDPNLAFVFLNFDANNIGAAASHEAGHGFGLQHQSAYDAAGNKTDEYSHGDGISAPIMGYGYDARNTWWSGQSSISASTIQNDVSVIASATNGFGYRSDDHPDLIATAKPMGLVANVGGGVSFFSASGVIERDTDQDWFSFTIDTAGNVAAAVNVAPQFADLDARLELRNSSGALVASADTSALGESITANLAAGTYRLGVMSRHYADGRGGVFERVGDIGQYTVRVEPPVGAQQSPYYGTPFSISPSAATTIQLEDYDHGGEGVAYHDTTAANTGGHYRLNEGVDIKSANDGTSGFRLSDVFAGEWVEYTVDVAEAGRYTFDFRAASPAGGASLHAAIDGKNVTGALTVPNTGGWSRYATVGKSGINLTAGEHVLRVAFDRNAPATGLVGGFDWLRISKTVLPPKTVTLNNSASSFVRNGAFADQNFGAAPTLELKRDSAPGRTREAYLSFDLSSVASISTAILRVFGRVEDATASNVGMGVYALVDPAAAWTENQLTFNNRPTSHTTALATTTVTDATGRWYTLDVTSYLKAQRAAGRKMVTLVLKETTTMLKRVSVNSDDAAANRPQLQITT